MAYVGTISSYETKRGPRWRFRGPLRKDPVTGKMGRYTVNGLLSWEEAHQAQVDYNASVGNIQLTSQATLRDTLELRWAEDGKSLSQNSVNTYMHESKRIPEWLMLKPIKDIERRHVDTALREILQASIERTDRAAHYRGKPYSLDHMEMIKGIISSAYRYAAAKNVPVGNPTTGIKLKRLVAEFKQDESSGWDETSWESEWGAEDTDPDDKPLTDVEEIIHEVCGDGPVIPVESLREFLETREGHWRAYFMTTFLQATRRGETLGMEWPRISPKRREMLIRKTVGASSGTLIISPLPKGGVERISYLDPRTLQELKAWREIQQRDREEWGDEWQDHWTFTMPFHRRVKSQYWYPGRHLHPITTYVHMRDYFKKKGVPNDGIRALRRTWATLAAELGVPAAVIGFALGHQPIAVVKKHYIRPQPPVVREAHAIVREHVLGPM